MSPRFLVNNRSLGERAANWHETSDQPDHLVVLTRVTSESADDWAILERWTFRFAEGYLVSKKTPPLSDQTGVTFFHQKQKGKPFDVSGLFSVPFWRKPENVVLGYGRTKRRFLLAAEQCWKNPMLSYPVRLLRRICFPSLHLLWKCLVLALA